MILMLIRQEEGRNEGAYSDEISCGRADGGTVQICRKTRPLLAQGSPSVKGFHVGNGQRIY